MHWWCVDNDNDIIDLTIEQYTSIGKTPPYENGGKSNKLGFAYKERMNTLLERVCLELEIISAWKNITQIFHIQNGLFNF